MSGVLTFSAQVWEHDGPGGWHFVTLPPEAAEQVEQERTGPRRGWGSVPVEVTIGTTTWRTSIFPDKASGSFLLPVKAQVRRHEDLLAGDGVEVRLVLEP